MAERWRQTMAIPTLAGLRNVKVPVTDLQLALDWYGRVFGFRQTIEFADADGVVRGVHGELPGIGDVLALREDPEAARGLGVFAIANFAVADRSALEAWVEHLDELGVPHGPIVDAPRLSLLVFANPDGQEIHLYTPLRPARVSAS
jgi:catechol-2,3-dioxygenase